MTPQEYQERKERTAQETLVMRHTEEGYHVYYPEDPKTLYRVIGNSDALTCTCPDYQTHQNDPQWQCKHIITIKELWGRSKGGAEEKDAGPVTSPLIQEEGKSRKKKTSASSNGLRVLKRPLPPAHQTECQSRRQD